MVAGGVHGGAVDEVGDVGKRAVEKLLGIGAEGEIVVRAGGEGVGEDGFHFLAARHGNGEVGAETARAK